MNSRFVRSLIALSASLLTLGPAAALPADELNTLSQRELDDGWILLFDGQTLFGWSASSQADWSVEDGAIRVAEGKPGLLPTTSQWGDFVLKLQFRAAPGTNSGVFLRTPPRLSGGTTRFYELNIADRGTSDYPTGSIVHRAKGIAVEDGPDWQSMEVTAVGGRFTLKIDGRRTLDYTDRRPLGRGYIGLQFHRGAVAFRDIKLKPLGLKPIFNGEDLDGWRVIQPFRDGKPAEIQAAVTDRGALRITNGPGSLETEGQWEDLVMQLQIFSAGEQLNSGVFFRTLPGHDWAGYESQIHNGYADGDRSRPTNCGTGGIWNRQDARLIVADDHQWFHKTIHAVDKHIAVWVNGIQVSDVTDRRQPADNAR
ncbi:MAG: 3-keto-disaccharide hydrolase [Pirellulales bacterium]